MSPANFALQLCVKALLLPLWLPLWLLNYVGIWGRFYKKFGFPYLMRRTAKDYNVKLSQTKRDLFHNLQDFAGPGSRLTLLELGCGTGTNFEFYPQGTRVICVDPNPHFEKFLRESGEEYPHLQLEKLVASGEDLKGVADGSVDVVVCTLVLCSVQNVQKVLNEAVRVLKPGGAFYFIEHVIADPTTWTCFFQHVFNPLWWYVGDGCSLISSTWKYLEAANFSDLKLRHLQAPLNIPLVRPHIVGYAVK